MSFISCHWQIVLKAIFSYQDCVMGSILTPENNRMFHIWGNQLVKDKGPVKTYKVQVTNLYPSHVAGCQATT